jgi:hypothetical protein
LVGGTSKVKANSRNSDLWTELATLLLELGPGNFVITKVASHQDGSKPISAFECWCFTYNGLADHAATVVHHMRTREFWNLYDTFVADSKYARYVSTHVQKILLDISRAVVQRQQECAEDAGEDTVQFEVQTLTPSCPFAALPEVGWVPRHLCDRFGQRIVKQIAAWFQQVLPCMEGASAEWVSFYQLYCDYMLCFGEGGPVRFDHWIDPVTRPNISLLDLSFKCRCRWFTHLLKQLWQEWQYKVQIAFTRPRSEVLILHTACARLPWPTERADIVEAWISSKLQGPAKRKGRQLLRLPTAGRNGAMPAADGSCMMVR